MMNKSISVAKARYLLKNLEGWKLKRNNRAIYRDYVMKDFMAAVVFIVRIAVIAQSQNHHPNIHLTRYRRLRVELTTDSIGGLSDKDFAEAAEINKVPVDLKEE